MRKNTESLWLGMLCVLCFASLWFTSLAAVHMVNEVFFSGIFSAAQLVYANIGVLILITLLQLWGAFRIGRNLMLRD